MVVWADGAVLLAGDTLALIEVEAGPAEGASVRLGSGATAQAVGGGALDAHMARQIVAGCTGLTVIGRGAEGTEIRAPQAEGVTSSR